MQVKPIKIVILYLLFNLTWILFGSALITLLTFIFPFGRETLEIIKDVFLVLVTAVLLYVAINSQQQLLLDSIKQYRNLFYSNPTPMWIYDRNTLKFLDVNNAAIVVYGYSKEEFKTMTILDIRKEEDHEKIIESIHKIADTVNISGNWEHFKKDGAKLTAYISSHKTIFDNKECVMVMAQDVTTQLEQERQLKLLFSTERALKEELERNIQLIEQSLEEKQRLAEVIDRIYNMVMITDTLGRIIWVNQAFVNFTGYTLAEVVGQTSAFLQGRKTDPEMQAKIMEAMRQNDFSVFEILNYTKAGKEYWVELTISAIYNEEGQVIRYIAVQNIITERKLSEDKIKRQYKLLKRLAWTNSHAIRKPVASLLSLVSLSEDTATLQEMKEINGHIGVCSKELDVLTRDIGKVMGSIDLPH
ncbi:PAS domain S-box-containing protein [Pedobacter sp. CG_S7]|uniref:PAS domain S-box protein n=1 Tax=Pedobacter sp. CG_S7 TaxID=3143930 RepID=UPI003392A589